MKKTTQTRHKSDFWDSINYSANTDFHPLLYELHSYFSLFSKKKVDFFFHFFDLSLVDLTFSLQKAKKGKGKVYLKKYG